MRAANRLSRRGTIAQEQRSNGCGTAHGHRRNGPSGCSPATRSVLGGGGRRDENRLHRAYCHASCRPFWGSLAGVNPWEEHDAREYDVTRTAIPARVAPEEDAARDVE